MSPSLGSIRFLPNLLEQYVSFHRDYFAEDEGEMVPRTSHAAAFLSDTKDRGPPVQSQIWRSGEKTLFGQTPSLRAFENPPQVQTQALRDFEKHLNDLKKENFSLKLRIYFLEERMQQKYEASRDDIYKRVSAGAARSGRAGAGGPPTALQALPPSGRPG
uniref:Centrosomin N-terminal motif 1 domain-containing protein n=1 Tax=Ursus maritimus TaxID=29073 RepID=A0A452VPF7_URSMA